MIRSHFLFIRQRANVRLAAAVIVALATFGLMLWAQIDDTPVTIADGSLTLDSAVPWANYANSGRNIKIHPNGGKMVSSVEITMPGVNQPPILFNNQRCTVDVAYATTDIMVATGNRGRGLRVTTDFDAFQPGNAPTRLVHRNAAAKISHVVVTRDGAEVFNRSPSGGTRIVIHYR